MAIDRRPGLTLIRHLVLGVALICAAPIPAQEDRNHRVAAYRNWSVFEASDPQTCWVASNPVETRINGAIADIDRGAVQDLLSVTFWPGSDPLGQLSLTPSGEFSDDTRIAARVAGENYRFELQGRTAWPITEVQDDAMLQGMGLGARGLAVTMTDSDGTITVFRYSLDGFLAALRDAKSRCAG